MFFSEQTDISIIQLLKCKQKHILQLSIASNKNNIIFRFSNGSQMVHYTFINHYLMCCIWFVYISYLDWLSWDIPWVGLLSQSVHSCSAVNWVNGAVHRWSRTHQFRCCFQNGMLLKRKQKYSDLCWCCQIGWGYYIFQVLQWGFIVLITY